MYRILEVLGGERTIEHNTYYRGKQRNLWDKIWRDGEGRVAIWQFPNAWLIAWAVLTVISLLFNRGMISDICAWAAAAALVIWSLLEIFRGVNYFRRAFGVAVLAFSIASIINLL